MVVVVMWCSLVVVIKRGEGSCDGRMVVELRGLMTISWWWW